MQEFNHLFIITHTDLDGVGSAAAALIASKRSPEEATIIYAEPYNLHESLKDLIPHVSQGDLVVISDLGINRDIYEQTLEYLRGLTSKGVSVEWYDHHVWDEEEKNSIREAGATLYVDTRTCATGVVARYMPERRGVTPEPFLGELERAVCAADLWRWDHPMAPKLYRVADYRYEDGREAWRNKLVEKFASGTLWDEELENALLEYVGLELSNYDAILSTAYLTPDPCRVAAVYKKHGPPSNSFVGASLLSRYEADIAVIIRDNGGVSLRSRSVDVSVVAKRLGGGGHPRAAGARLRIGFGTRLIATILGRRRLAKKAAKTVRKAALDLGVC